MFTINELSKRTGLNVNFIRKCQNRLKDVLDDFIKRGDKNRILFSDSAIVIFDRIKGYKNDGLSIPEIGKRLRQSLEKGAETGQTGSSNTAQTAGKTIQAYPNNDMKGILDNLIQNFDRILEEKEKHFRELQEKDSQINELEKANQTLLDNLKLLPEGKTPEQIKADWENQHKKIQEKRRIIDEIRKTGIFSIRKRRKLLSELERY